MAVGKVLNDVKPYLAMILLQVGFAGMYIVAVASLKRGMSHFVLVVYRNLFATAVMAPFALWFERKSRPRMTITIFLKIMGLALLEYTRAGSEPLLHGLQPDRGQLRVGAYQHSPGRHIRPCPRPAHGEGASAERAQPGQDRRHAPHRRRRRAHDPVPRPRGAVPVVQGAAPPRQQQRSLRRQFHYRNHHHRHRLHLLVGLLRPPVQHAQKLPRGAVADDAHLPHGLADERLRRARRRAPQHPGLGHRLRHPPLHCRLRRYSVLRSGILRARYRVEATRPGVRHGLQSSLHDHNRRHGLHHTQRRDHSRKHFWRCDHRARPVRAHLGQEQGPGEPGPRRLSIRRLQGRRSGRRAAHHLGAAQRQRQQQARPRHRPRWRHLRRRDARGQRPLLELARGTHKARKQPVPVI